MTSRPRGCDAVVLGLDANGYGIVRSLAAHGLRVAGLWSERDHHARFSRLVRAVRVRADDDAELVAVIRDMAGGGSRPVLFATSDRLAHFLARNQEALASVTRYHWVAPDLLDTVMDKNRIRQACAAAGLEVPRTQVPTLEGLSHEAAAFAYPCIVKPLDSLGGALPGGAKTLICRSPDDLTALYRAEPSLVRHTLWQEIIEGDDDDVYQGTVLAAEPGRVFAAACVRKLRQYPPGYGIMSFGRTEWHDDVVELATRLVAALGWTGLASVEFKRRRGDGRLYFIEMNPRLPWYNMLLTDAGVNLPYLTWRALAGDVPAAPRQRDEVTWLSLELEIGGYWRRRRQRTLGLGKWLASISTARSYAWFAPTDPGPVLAATLDLARIGIVRLRAALRRTWRALWGGEESVLGGPVSHPPPPVAGDSVRGGDRTPSLWKTERFGGVGGVEFRTPRRELWTRP